ncbi:uncharacterized protein LOC118754956 isoform X2 [Rhagoletis pomonella]|uniref:uncharacterized protein LOC118754956 isoform X2 n=1 Tax=Rhagoletis pomonella TaxID=28610 RepID=UPI00177AC6E2|nr:uncharacterized protein LOC118754956 isoform X2 [Rhagoletis pomonella]
MWTREQHSCEKLYNDTVTRSPNGRIVVKLPFKDDPACLGESYTTALRRFSAQERRLQRSPNLRTQYVEFMDEYERLGHMQVALSPNLNQPHYYIPHHCVLKPGSTTTKLRVVFDAFCQTTTQTSFNDIQMVGPIIQSELVVLLLQFRLHRFALTAEIVKMYRQVLVSEEHRMFQYILWRSSPNQEIQTFQLNTVTYGMEAKWHSNHKRFRGEHSVKDFNLDTSITSTLVLTWDQTHDNFLFSFQSRQPTNSRVTKRTILSTASSLFDPLGLLAPVIVTAKILLQEMWLLKL